MTKREVVIDALCFRRPPYVPWAWRMTQLARKRLAEHLDTNDLSPFVGSHFLELKTTVPLFQPVRTDVVRDIYGVTWDRRVDKDIGSPIDWPLRRPEDLARYDWPDASAARWTEGVAETAAASPKLFRQYKISFALYERAWHLRGVSALLVDMIERPEFVEELLDAIVAHRLDEIHQVLRCDVDAVYFGDDYGMQTGLIMGIKHWRHFIKPRLARLFAPVREAGKFVFLHSDGAVAELFDDLIKIGLDVFNPFQPEVMDITALKRQYHGRLSFHGGLGVQSTLPFGGTDDVRRATEQLVELGRDGGMIVSPSHSVPPDVPPENLLAMMDVLRAQPGAERD